MDAQIQQAVEIASSATNDQNLKEQALQFINQIKSSDEGWQHCVNLLNTNDSLSPNVKFFVFQVLNDRLSSLSNDQKITLKDYLFGYLNKLISKDQVEPAYLRNALAKTFGSVFVHSTLTCYSTLIKDLLSLAKSSNSNTFNDLATDYYLRTLLVIHQEIGEQMIIRDKERAERDNLLKDAIRESDMVSMATTWKQVLQHYTNISSKLSGDIINSTIQCIGSYVSWIEINLILDQDYLTLLYQFLGNSQDYQQRVITSNAFNEILHKKMPPVKKLELINFLNLGYVFSQMGLKSKTLHYEVSVAFAKLVNKLGSELVSILDSSSNQDLSNLDFKNMATSKILELLPIIFDFLENEYDDISLEIFPFVADFLLFLKKNITNEDIDFSAISNDQIITTLLKKIIMKMKYDEDDDGDDDETIEQFTDIRNRLKTFQDSIMIINEELSLDVMIDCINESLFNSNGSNGDWRTVEVGLYQLTHYSEVLRNNVMNLPKTMINNSRPYFVFNEMLCKVIDNSTSILISHPLIQLLFFELVLKHYTFFNNSNIQVEGVDKNEILLKVLKIFVSNFGVFSDNEKVKYRSWYLFYRFIKYTKPRIDDFIIKELISNLLPLLIFNFENINLKQQQLTNYIDLTAVEEESGFEHQLFLFEAIGLLITLIHKTEEKILMFESVLQPLFSNLENCINNLPNLNLNIVIQVHHSMHSVGTILKGFESLPVNEFDEKFVSLLQQVSQVILITLENFIDFNIVREAAEFCIVRLFILLAKLPTQDITRDVLSKFISTMMINFDKAKMPEITNFLNFITQVFHGCNNSQSIYGMLNSLISPLIGKVIARIELETNNVNDDFTKIEILDLQKSMITLLIGISNDHLNSLWLTDENKETLTSVINLLFNYIYTYHQQQQAVDLSLVKVSIGELNALVQGIGAGKVIDPLDVFKNDNNVFEQVESLLINNVIMISLELCFKCDPGMLKDPQFRSCVFLEVARLLKAIAYVGYELPEGNNGVLKQKGSNGNGNKVNGAPSIGDLKFNEMMCGAISSALVNNLGFPVELSREFVEQLIKSVDRHFLKYLMGLVEKYKQ